MKDKSKVFKIVGLILMIIGLCMLFVPVITIPIVMGGDVDLAFDISPFLMSLPFIGIVTLFIGQLLYRKSRISKLNKKDANEDPNAKLDELFKKQNNINSTIICGNCKGVNESSNTFCKHCGKPLYNECPKCHYLNDNSATYCTKCGEKLEK